MQKIYCLKGIMILLLIFFSEKGLNKRITWKDLYGNVCRLSNYFYKIGLKKGDRVVLMCQILLSQLYLFWQLQKTVSFGLHAHQTLEAKVLLIDFIKSNQKF